MDEKFKKALIILVLGLLSFFALIIGLRLGIIPYVLSIMLGIFSYIIRFDEKRNGNFNPIGSIGVFIGLISGAISIIMLIQLF